MAAVRMTIRRRVFSVFALLLSFQLVLMGRLAWLQLVRGAELSERAFYVRTREVPVEAKRGTVYDRLGRELAISVNVDSVYAVPLEIPADKAPEVARRLAEVLDLDYETLLERLIRRQAFVWIQRKISSDQARQLKELLLPGIGFTQEAQRFYPKGSLASHVLGFAGIDSQGLAGLEYSYDRYVRGQPGKIVIEYDGRGRELPQALHRFYPPTDGYDLVTSLDEYIQHIVEREAERAMEQWQPIRVTVVVMDPRNGQILAMANRPDYDPNRFADYPPEAYRNAAVEAAQPPGSMFKPVTVAAALEEGVVNWNSTFFCGGSIQVPGSRISCWRGGGHGSLDLSGALENSCNVALVQIGLRLGADAFFRHYQALGFGAVTGIDLPGENRGLTVRREDLRPVDLAVMSFGQTLTATPVQLLTAIAAIANGGYLVQPHLGLELRSADGREIIPLTPEPARQVLSPRTAAEVMKAMEATVREGTGRPAYMEGYALAGKTGTAQKVVGGRVSSEHHLAGFAGYGPVPDPRVAVLVVVDEPTGSTFGSQVAAPVFRAIMEDVYRYLEIPVGPDSDRSGAAVVPQLVGMEALAAAGLLESRGLRPVFRDEGPRVADQVPPAGTRLPPGSEVMLRRGGEEQVPGLVTVPTILGKTILDAARVLGEAGLRLEASGSGVAVEQHPEPGVAVRQGTPVRVEFRPPGR
ncbi:MAG: penicillin-binding transpeptidase domain-containing protein [bacterium]|nr:penicillin-binding transpeptidase domain-containing protein [bacterium]